MPEDRVLVSIVSTFNAAGVAEAKAGLLGFTSANMVALAAMGLLFEAAKSAIQITEEHTKAEANLTNAIQNRHRQAKAVNDSLVAFMQTNSDFISSQNEVVVSYARLIREGVKTKDLSHLMSIALNIQGVEGGTLTEAVDKLQLAEAGRNRGLTTAVGLVLKAIPAHATYAQKMHIVAHNIAAVERAYRHGTRGFTPYQIAQDKLKTAWEKLAEKDGPALILGLTSVVGEIAKDLPVWEHWLGVIGNIVSQIYALNQLTNKSGWDTGTNIRNLGNDPAHSDPNSMSVSAQQHKGQPSYGTAVHNRSTTSTSKTATTYITVITLDGKKIAQVVAPIIRKMDRSLS